TTLFRSQSAVFVGIVGRGILDEDDVPTLDQSAELLGGGVDGLLGSEGGVGLTLGLDVGQTQQADLDGLGAGLQSQGRGASGLHELVDRLLGLVVTVAVVVGLRGR